MDAEANRRTATDGRGLGGSAAAYIAFCGLGLLSRFVPAVFLLFVAYGIAFPLVWAGITGRWGAIGFSGRALGRALLWGVIAGVAWGVYTTVVFRADESLPSLWSLQVAIAAPVWLAIMSPFQEFFFRGWLQPRLQAALGRPVGLVVTSLAFTLWHFFPQFEGTLTATLPLSSPIGVVSVVLLGLLLGYIHQRTENIVAPWVAHAIGGLALVLIGRMTFIQYVP